MDNITHSLIGVAIAHAVGRLTIPRKPGASRARVSPRYQDPAFRAILWTAMIGSNFPDVDTPLQPLVGMDQLSYLLHHRGYTHTILAVPLLGWLAAWLGSRLSGWRKLDARLLLLGVGSVALHVGADFWNDYGVHPFAPFDNRWFYGDFIFIVEPLLWLALLPTARKVSRTIFGRALCDVLTALILFLAWFGAGGSMMGWQVAFGVTLWGWLFRFMARSSDSPAIPWAAIAAVLLAFQTGAVTAQKAVEGLASQRGVERLGLALTPAPSNPFCWRVILASRDPDGTEVTRLGALSLDPRLFDPLRCVPRLASERTAKLSEPSLPSGKFGFGLGSARNLPAQVEWIGELRHPKGEAQKLASENCQFDAFLRFARVPFWERRGDGTLWAGDLRYDFEKDAGFALIRIPRGQESCQTWVPGWSKPNWFISNSN